MDIDSFRAHLVATLSRTHSGLRLEVAATEIARYFGGQAHEIGFFQVELNSRLAYFRWPPSQIGMTFSLNAFASSLVTTTARQRQGVINNSFASTPHLHMFENTLADREQRIPIQKIMSAPAVDGELLRWIIQMTRKGKTIDEAGPDFTETELNHLQQIAVAIAPLLL
jgi:hypothetical protein